MNDHITIRRVQLFEMFPDNDSARQHVGGPARGLTRVILFLLSGLVGCSSKPEASGKYWSQGCVNGRRLEVTCIGRGRFYDCDNSWGEAWHQTEKPGYLPHVADGTVTYACFHAGEVTSYHPASTAPRITPDPSAWGLECHASPFRDGQLWSFTLAEGSRHAETVDAVDLHDGRGSLPWCQ